jgi:hypothetical protein
VNMKVPSDARLGFWIAIGVLSALAVWSFAGRRLPGVMN